MSIPAVTLVTHTCVVPGHTDEFVQQQQQQVNDAVARFPGYLDHTVVPPAPPVQTDWVIVQRFQSVEVAQAWLQSEQMQHLLNALQPLLVGQDDVHLFTQDAPRYSPASVSAIISSHRVSNRILVLFYRHT